MGEPQQGLPDTDALADQIDQIDQIDQDAPDSEPGSDQDQSAAQGNGEPPRSADPPIDELTLMNERLALERERNNALQQSIEREKKRFRDRMGEMGSRLESLRRSKKTDAMDDPDDQDLRTDPRRIPDVPPDLGDTEDLTTEVREIRFQRIREEEGDQIVRSYPVLQDPKYAEEVVNYFRENANQLNGIEDRVLYRMAVKGILYDAVARLATKLRKSPPAKASASDLDKKKELSTPAQAMAGRSPKSKSQDPSGMSRKEMFRAYMKEGRPGFTMTEYRKLWPDG